MLVSSSFRLSVLTAVFVLAAPLSKAGSIVFTDTTKGSASVSTYTPLVSYLTPGCGAFPNIYDHCTARLKVDTFGGSTALVQIVDNTTGASHNYLTSQVGVSVYSDGFLDPFHTGDLGVSIDAGFSDPVSGVATLAFDLFGYQGYSDEGTCSFCTGTITGGVQQAFTINYLDASNNILGSDVVSFQAQGSNTPEPGTTLTMLSGFVLLGIASIRRFVLAR